MHSIGKIVRIEGPVIEAQFDPASLPAIFGALTVTDPLLRLPVTVCAAQHLDPGIVRGVALSAFTGLTPGLEITSAGLPVDRPVPNPILIQAVQVLGRSQVILPEPLETGIKAIDLLCPLVKGGKVGIFGEWGAGVLVLIRELLHHLADRPCGLTLFALVPPQPDVDKWQQNNTDVAASTKEIQTVYLPAADPADPAFQAKFGFLDAVLYLTRRLSTRGLYPSLDPLLSHSRASDTVGGWERREVAKQVRQVLGRHLELQPAIEAGQTLSQEDNLLVSRAIRIERFLTQPYSVAEPYTGMPGQHVSGEEMLLGCEALLAGKYDSWPEQAFYMVGTLDQALEKAQRVAG